jgi:alkanesulfonate monooxygenase SsuD/methylene tetrahydromethanopterin reductase-like flavin-dependent oxidoreductase (luciferase family)
VEIVELMSGMEDRGWQARANCMGVDPDLFFPERGASTREAKEVCRGCVAREDCLEYALDNGEKFGIWGQLARAPPVILSGPDLWSIRPVSFAANGSNVGSCCGFRRSYQ